MLQERPKGGGGMGGESGKTGWIIVGAIGALAIVWAATGSGKIIEEGHERELYMQDLARDVGRPALDDAICTKVKYAMDATGETVLQTFNKGHREYSDPETRLRAVGGIGPADTAAGMTITFCTVPSTSTAWPAQYLRPYDMYLPNNLSGQRIVDEPEFEQELDLDGVFVHQ